MSRQVSTARRSRGLPALAILALIAGFVVLIAGELPLRASEPAHVAIAAMSAVPNDSAGPVTRRMTGHRWWGIGSRWSSYAASPGQDHWRGEPAGQPGERRDYLLRSAAFARQRLWMAKAVTPEFS